MASQLMQEYYDKVTAYMRRILVEEEAHIMTAARVIADHIAKDKLVYLWGPGGHSNIAAMEVFFRAGGLMHINAIFDEGTMISSGALRSMQMERLPGYGDLVVRTNNIGEGDLFILVNAYGINAALIGAALEAKRRGATTIGISSVEHAEHTAPDHVARHPSRKNLHEVVDYHIDSKVPVGDALMQIDGITQPVGALSTFTNGYTMQTLMLTVIDLLAKRGIEPPIWRSGNAPGGDAWNNQFMDRFEGKIKHL